MSRLIFEFYILLNQILSVMNFWSRIILDAKKNVDLKCFLFGQKLIFSSPKIIFGKQKLGQD